jgi:hypothetical protein
MQTKKYPSTFPVEKHYPERDLLLGLEGGAIWIAEKEGRYYLIVDERSMADFLTTGEDDDLLNEIVKIYEFDSDQDRQRFIQEQGWFSLSK